MATKVATEHSIRDAIEKIKQLLDKDDLELLKHWANDYKPEDFILAVQAKLKWKFDAIINFGLGRFVQYYEHGIDFLENDPSV